MAVYTKISLDQVNALLEEYSIGKAQNLQPITGGIQNTNYVLQTDSGKFVLTIFELDYYLDNLGFYANYLENLYKAGISCPRPMENKNGDKFFTLGEKKGIIVNFLEGLPINQPKATHCQQVGAVLAKTHLVGLGYTAAPKMHRLEQINYYFNSVKNNDITNTYAGLINDEIDYQKEHYPNNLPRGIIHSDLFIDNVFFKDNKLTAIIDIYDSHEEFLLYDLAVTVNAWCFIKETGWQLDQDLMLSMLQGYQSERRLEPSEISHFNTVLRAASLKNMLMRIRFNEFNKEATKLNPKNIDEYAQKLTHWQNNPANLDILQ